MLFNNDLFAFLRNYSTNWSDFFMLFITDFGLFLILTFFSIFLLLKKRYKEFFLAALAACLSLESAYLLKKTLQIPRPPFSQFSAYTYAYGYSFPSLHAALSSSIIPFVFRSFRKTWIKVLVVVLLILIALSRVYLGVHYIEDVIFGALIGFGIGYYLLSLNDKYDLYHRTVYSFFTKLEFRRQIAHLLTGISIVLMIKLNIIDATFLIGILFVGAAISIISRKYRIPYIYNLLEFFERPNEIKKFPGKGSFFLVLGSTLSLVLFEKSIALAAITIMAIGDSITSLVGVYFAKYKNPFNPSKHIEGTVLAIFLSTLGAYTFVDFEKALFGSVVGMIFEMLTSDKINRVIDDNVLIPLVAGFAMLAF